MRILVINQYFPPDASSTAYILGELAEDLGRDHDVQIIAGRPSYEADTSTYIPHGDMRSARGLLDPVLAQDSSGAGLSTIRPSCSSRLSQR